MPKIGSETDNPWLLPELVWELPYEFFVYSSIDTLIHALSYPLGGEANYAFFIEVFKFYNKSNPNGKIKRVNKFIADILNVPEEKAYEALEELLKNLIVRKNLNEYGMKEEEIEIFSQGVIETQGRLFQNNYVEMTLDDTKKIYRDLYK
ncbi:iron-containing alcohol dehydrogenase [Clostridium tagluense]|nr:iron-containing alcohol dehydrogenase [Clostridium tagluense]